MVAFEHVTSWLQDLRAHADENVAIIRELVSLANWMLILVQSSPTKPTCARQCRQNFLKYHMGRP